MVKLSVPLQIRHLPTNKRDFFYGFAFDLCCRSGTFSPLIIWAAPQDSQDPIKCSSSTSCSHDLFHFNRRWLQVIDKFCCGSIMGFLLPYCASALDRCCPSLLCTFLGSWSGYPSYKGTFVRQVRQYPGCASSHQCKRRFLGHTELGSPPL